MARYIDVDKFWDNFNDEIEMGVDDYPAAVSDALNNTPAEDVRPVVHAHWIKMYDYDKCRTFKCSRCGREIIRHVEETILDYPYCHCGAKMDEVVSKNEI